MKIVKTFKKQALSAIVFLFTFASSYSVHAQAQQLFIPISVSDVTTFVPILPAPSNVSITIQNPLVGGPIHSISWSAVNNADHYRLVITDEEGNKQEIVLDDLDYDLAALPLGESRVEIWACNAYFQCGAAALVGTYTSNERVRYAHADILGSPILETDQAGNVLQEFHYKPFGETFEEQRDDIGYTGHLEDSDLGLTYMQARYYDPALGRFYSNDPVSFMEHLNGVQGFQGFNRYSYVNNNPYKYVDPDGEAGAGVVITGVAIIGTWGYRAYKIKKQAAKIRTADFAFRVATISETLFYTDRPLGSRPPIGEDVFTAVAKESITGTPTKGKFHRDKAAQVANRFIKLKGEIVKNKIISKKQKRKLLGAINAQLKPLKAVIDTFDKSPLTPADAKKVKVRKDEWKIK